MKHLYRAIPHYDGKVLKYQGQGEPSAWINEPDYEPIEFDAYKGDRILSEPPHTLVTGTTGRLPDDIER